MRRLRSWMAGRNESPGCAQDIPVLGQFLDPGFAFRSYLACAAQHRKHRCRTTAQASNPILVTDL